MTIQLSRLHCYYYIYMQSCAYSDYYNVKLSVWTRSFSKLWSCCSRWVTLPQLFFNFCTVMLLKYSKRCTRTNYTACKSCSRRRYLLISEPPSAESPTAQRFWMWVRSEDWWPRVVEKESWVTDNGQKAFKCPAGPLKKSCVMTERANAPTLCALQCCWRCWWQRRRTSWVAGASVASQLIMNAQRRRLFNFYVFVNGQAVCCKTAVINQFFDFCNWDA